MPYCKQCGAEIGDVNFCPGCGASVGKFRAANSETVDASVDAPEVPGFLRALAICLGKKYCCFKDRASRSEFWFFFLGTFLLFLVLAIVPYAAFFTSLKLDFDIPDYFSWIMTFRLVRKLFFLLLVVPLTSVGVRRYHDVGLPGWIYVVLFLIVCALNIAVRFALIIAWFSDFPDGPKSEESFLNRLPIWSYYVFGAIILASLFNLIFLSERGTRGPNKYGPAPAKKPKS